MTILDWIQTICSLISLLLSFFAISEVNKIKKQIKSKYLNRKVSQSIKGDGNSQNVSNTSNSNQ